jgi:hypothetical protein
MASTEVPRSLALHIPPGRQGEQVESKIEDCYVGAMLWPHWRAVFLRFVEFPLSLHEMFENEGMVKNATKSSPELTTVIQQIVAS